MNSNESHPTPEDLEVQLTALILGELTPSEEARLRSRMKKDAGLRVLHADLEKTIGFLQEATLKTPFEGGEEGSRLSPKKRNELVQILAPSGALPEQKAFWSREHTWWVPMALAASLVLLVSISVFLNSFQSRPLAQRAHPVSEEVSLFDSDSMSRSTPTALGRGGQKTFSNGRSPEIRFGNEPGAVTSSNARGLIEGAPVTVSAPNSELGSNFSSISASGPAEPDRRSNETWGFQNVENADINAVAGTESMRRLGRSIAPGPPAAGALSFESDLEPSTRTRPNIAFKPAAEPALPSQPTVGFRIQNSPELSSLRKEKAAIVPSRPAGQIEVKGEIAELEEEASRYLPIDVVNVEPPQNEPETVTLENPVSTFSLNVSDVSWKLSQSQLANNQMPDPGSIRPEEFLNAFDYKDSLPPPGEAIGVQWERSEYPFLPSREALRVAVNTGVSGRVPGMDLNLVLLLDNSGSMERPDRVATVQNALASLANELEANDRISLLLFARSPRLVLDGVKGGFKEQIASTLNQFVPEGGTNLEAALTSAYEIAERHYIPGGNNRVILLTDGAANLGNVNPDSLSQNVIDQRKKGIALDAFGVGWDGYDDLLLERLTRNGDGRYRFLNSAETAGEDFADLLAGSLEIAAKDLKVQVVFNSDRVDSYRLIGYRKHRLTEEQFRDDTVDAAELGGEESGQALYILKVNNTGTGPLGVVRVRYKEPAYLNVNEKEWVLPYEPGTPVLTEASPAMKLAVSSAAFAEWLGQSPYAGEVSPSKLLGIIQDVPRAFPLDYGPVELQEAIRQAGQINGF